MSIFEIKMPKLGESVTEGTIVNWSVKVGDTVKEDDALFEVTTAKVNAEVPSPVAGEVVKILFNTGDVVPVGVVVALIQMQGNDSGNISDAKATEDAAPSHPENTEFENAGVKDKDINTEPKQSKSETARWYSPIVLSLANESGITTEELERIPGTGYLGRLSKKDITNYINTRQKGLSASTKEVSYIKEPVVTGSVPGKVASVNTGVNAGQQNEDSVAVEMDPVARIIADRMIESKNVSAHVTTVVEADVTKLVHWRNIQKEAFLKNEGVSLTYMPAIVWAVSKALKEFPKVNASVDGHRFILKKQINIGIAVSLDDGNLVVPVVHNTDKLSLSGIAIAVDNAAKKARANKLTIDDIEGGTFTITNFGTFRNIIGTPIINQPQVAILGVGYFEKKPAVIETPEGDTIAIRHKAYLSLSYDHRIINGALGGAFLRRVADLLESWNTL
jgi:2-oxoglutarate dehydrogenase E2 component (dihydrolipoamide succinyltransferase)